jgi:hypothetical protein
MTLGQHQMNIGFNWVHTQMNANGPFQQNPRMTFNGQLTGNALTDFMTGNLDTMLQGNGQIGRDGQNMPAAYFQDQWKISRRFQVNIGLRWDPFIPQHTKYDYASQFDPARFYTGQLSKIFVNAPPGLTFPGDTGYPGHSDTFPRYLDFAPRIGLVYDPRGKGTETVRAGYGIFYDSTYLWNTLHIPLNPPWGNTITISAPPGGLSNPWAAYPGGNPFPTATRLPADFQFPVDGVFVFEPLHAHATYIQQWNVAVQKQITANWLVSATYLGNKTTHQWLGYQVNPSVYIPGGPCTLLGVTYNPCSSTASTEARRTFALANPATGKYYGNIAIVDDSGNADYHALLLVAQHRFSHNFSILSNFTWSHCLDQGENGQDIVNFYQDPRNRRAESGNCASRDSHSEFRLTVAPAIRRQLAGLGHLYVRERLLNDHHLRGRQLPHRRRLRPAERGRRLARRTSHAEPVVQYRCLRKERLRHIRQCRYRDHSRPVRLEPGWRRVAVVPD